MIKLHYAFALVALFLLSACSQVDPNLNIQPNLSQTEATPPAVPTKFAANLAFSFVTPTPHQTETPRPVPQATGWGEPDMPITRKANPLAPLQVPLLPTVIPELLANVAIAPKNILQGDENSPRIALTFDTGAGTPIVRLILSELREANVHATFFIVGNWAEQNTDLVHEIATEGHDLANHSWSHPDFTKLSDDQMLAQVQYTEQVVYHATGCTTRPFFRAPFGSLNNHVLQVLGQAGYESIFWSAHGGDWLPGTTMESVRATVERHTGNGAIIVLHSSVLETAQAVPAIIGDLRARGFEFVRLTELLASDPAHPMREACKPK